MDCIRLHKREELVISMYNTEYFLKLSYSIWTGDGKEETSSYRSIFSTRRGIFLKIFLYYRDCIAGFYNLLLNFRNGHERGIYASIASCSCARSSTTAYSSYPLVDNTLASVKYNLAVLNNILPSDLASKKYLVI